MSQPVSTLSPQGSAIVEDLGSYYRLLIEMGHLQLDVVEFPPANGWNEPNQQALFQRLGKSADVVGLFARLPYITDKHFEIQYDTSAIDWRSWYVGVALDHGMSLQQASLEPILQTLPDHVVCLTKASNYGRWPLLDTVTGNVTDYSVLGELDPIVSEEQKDAGLAWTVFPSQPLTSLLADWSTKLRSLEWVPVPRIDGNGGTIRLPVTLEDPEQQVSNSQLLLVLQFLTDALSSKFGSYIGSTVGARTILEANSVAQCFQTEVEMPLCKHCRHVSKHSTSEACPSGFGSKTEMICCMENMILPYSASCHGHAFSSEPNVRNR